MSSSMNGSPNENPSKDMKWIPSFLQWRYFSTFCPLHGKALSKFCTTCDEPLCPQCVKGINLDHEGHSIIQISRFESKEAVMSSLISNYIHCHDIQPYVLNKTPVVMLQPYLSLSDTDGSSSIWSNGRSCRICGSDLTSDDPLVCFCSIYCKVTAYAHNSDGSMHTLFVEPTMENVEGQNGNYNIVHEGGAEEVDEEGEDDHGGDGHVSIEDKTDDGEERQSYRRRSRKGTPRRAPFF